MFGKGKGRASEDSNSQLDDDAALEQMGYKASAVSPYAWFKLTIASYINQPTFKREVSRWAFLSIDWSSDLMHWNALIVHEPLDDLVRVQHHGHVQLYRDHI